MTRQTDRRLAWEPAFLAALATGDSVRAAAKAAAITSSTAYWLRNRNARFAGEWEQALGADAATTAVSTGGPGNNHWRKSFLEALAETSNVTAAAARANVPVRTVYKLRREEPEFAARWLGALNEGYDNLEMELLGFLRDAQPQRKMDVAAALRLLAAHRDTVERRRALAEEDDEQAVLESIDRFIDEMRVRRAANNAILIETGGSDGAE